MMVFSVVGHVHIRPVEVEHVYILELHELQCFLDFSLHALSPKVPNLGSDEEFLSFDSSLGDDCLYGCA